MNEIPKLQRVTRLDSIKVDETYYTSEGFLIDHPIVTTVGIFEYMNPDGSIRRELRLPEEVFAPESLASYKGKPIIVTHRAGRVTTDNVEKETIGTILSEASKDGENVRVEIVIHNTDALKTGLRELSLGYDLDLDETPGEWNGQPYDAIQRNIRVNHLALVSAARAGEQARLNIDEKENLTGGPEMEQNKTDSGLSPEELEEAIADYIAKKNAATTSTDGDTATGETTPAPDGEVAAVKPEEQADEEDVVQSVKERRDRRDAETASNSKETALETITQQDADIDALLKLIEQLKAKSDFADANADSDDTGKTDCGTIQKDGDESKSQSLNLDSAAVDRLVASKIDVIRIADKLHLDGVDVMSVKDGKKAVIKSVYPEMRLDGKSDDYIDALYDLTKQKIKGDNNTDKQRKQMFNKDAAPDEEQSVTGADAARNRMIEKQKNGGK
jgi:hypothetical protein